MEDSPLSGTTLSPEECSAVQHFKVNHTHTKEGRFVVPVPKRENVKHLGEFRSQALHFFSLVTYIQRTSFMSLQR